MAKGGKRGHPVQVRFPENIDLICELTATGWSVRQIAAQLKCDPAAIRQWRREDGVFAEKFHLAKQEQMYWFAEEIIEISDNGSNDWMHRELEAGGIETIPDIEHLNRSRMRIDTRKWLMAKMAPRWFGDRVEHTHTGTVDVVQSVEDRRKRARAIIDAAFEDVTQHGQIEDASSEAIDALDGEN